MLFSLQCVRISGECAAAAQWAVHGTHIQTTSGATAATTTPIRRLSFTLVKAIFPRINFSVDRSKHTLMAVSFLLCAPTCPLPRTQGSGLRCCPGVPLLLASAAHCMHPLRHTPPMHLPCRHDHHVPVVDLSIIIAFQRMRDLLKVSGRRLSVSWLLRDSGAGRG